MKHRQDTEFESVYHPDDSLQSVEVSFFKNNFKYEGDDFQDTSREETNWPLRTSKQSTRAFSSHVKRPHRASSQSPSQQNDEDIEEIADEYLGPEGLDNILSGIEENEQTNLGEESIINHEGHPAMHTYNDLPGDDHSFDPKRINQAILKAIIEGKKDKLLKMCRAENNHGLLDMNFKNENGLNAVLLSCMAGNLDILKILVNELEGNVSVINSVNRQVGLHYACIQNNHEILQFLLSKNQTLKNFQDVWGGTPLFYAALNSSEKCVEILLSQDANTDLLNNDGLSALDVTTSVAIQKMIKKKIFMNNNRHRKLSDEKSIQQEIRSSFNSNNCQRNSFTTPKEEIGSNIVHNDVLEGYERTQLFKSNRLACNSRKDRVSDIINKAKGVYNLGKNNTKGIQQNKGDLEESHHVPEKKISTEKNHLDNHIDQIHAIPNNYSNGVHQINGFVVSREQRSRRNQVKLNFRKQWEVAQKEVEEQKDSNERCRIYLSRMRKLEAPMKLRRKVTLDDFIFYRRVGEGSFGEVYLVKIKPGILKIDQPDKAQEESRHHHEQQQQHHSPMKNHIQEQQTIHSSPSHQTSADKQQSNHTNISPSRSQNSSSSPPKTRFLQYKKREEQHGLLYEKTQQQEHDQPNENDLQRKINDMKQQQQLHSGAANHVEEHENNNSNDPENKFYALKVIKKEALQRKKVAEYIEFEKSVMQEMHHPFIASLHLSFQNDSYLFILMDFYPGGDLGRILEKDIEVDEKQIKIWAAQIVLALEELHSKDIIYRDLKPENVVLDEKGNLHLIDFGLAKRGVNVLTQSFCGTPIYLPPEIIGKSGHNKMVDWYSLGVIIYELLVGRPPYFSSDCKQLFNDIQTQPLRLPKSLNEDAKSILIQLLRKNYKARLGFTRDAAEIKEHPWFHEIEWDLVLSKQYDCLKPVSLTIPANPMELKLKHSGKGYPVDLKTRWSFCVLEDQTAKQGGHDQINHNNTDPNSSQSHQAVHQSAFHRWNEQLKEETKRLNENHKNLQRDQQSQLNSSQNTTTTEPQQLEQNASLVSQVK